MKSGESHRELLGIRLTGKIKLQLLRILAALKVSIFQHINRMAQR